MEDTEGFKEMMRMDLKHFKEILNPIAPAITAQAFVGANKVISAAEHLTMTLKAHLNETRSELKSV